jgi:sRNA-binding carbon storage regulator CsrA
MLVLSRKENESIRIEPADGLDPSLTLREAFANGAIVVRLQRIGHRRVQLVIEAPPALKVMRSHAPQAAVDAVDLQQEPRRRDGSVRAGN